MIYLVVALWPHLLVAFGIGLLTGYCLRRERTGEVP